MVKTCGCSTCVYIYIHTHMHVHIHPDMCGTTGRLYPLIFPSYFLPLMGETSRRLGDLASALLKFVGALCDLRVLKSSSNIEQ